MQLHQLSEQLVAERMEMDRKKEKDLQGNQLEEAELLGWKQRVQQVLQLDFCYQTSAQQALMTNK